ncbi:TPA: hypothetical protein NG573_004279 [Vibrio parahaemolyticus]|uniref:hypothetical protein n=1 Tax=Vibrio parahaemolyticus TaxID=670 RepID=UPI001E390393|nr:hypothetical protein [Vibrio parahaemolyticus]HCE2128177.1 hypothetical protein [Vibrio parahaemolyticus]HCE3220884.1 hypothetical protein [Vibrio parahaemolyticus]HCM1038592.1 hypothetical protein [Vibrio parahaemolyticus]
MENIILLLRSEAFDVGVEEKYAILRLLHLSNLKGGRVVAVSARELAGELFISMQSMLLAVKYLESQEYLDKSGDWSKSGTDKEVTYVLTSDFYACLNRDDSVVSSMWLERLSVLLASKELNHLSTRAAVKLLLLTLVAHADENGVVRNLSIKRLTILLGRFSKDRHRSQMALLTKRKLILEYCAGLSGHVLFGKQSSEYLVNIYHPAFQVEDLPKFYGVVAKGCNLKEAEELCHLATPALGELVVIEEENSRYKGSVYVRVQKLQHALFPNDREGFFASLRHVESALKGEGKGFLLQRYVLRIAFDMLKNGDDKEAREAIWSRVVFNELFSEKFINALPVSLGLKPEDNWLKWREVFSCSGVGKNHLNQVNAIVSFIERLVIVSLKGLSVFIESSDVQITEKSQLALFCSQGVNTLYLFNVNKAKDLTKK